MLNQLYTAHLGVEGRGRLTQGPLHKCRPAPFGQKDPIRMPSGDSEPLRTRRADQHGGGAGGGWSNETRVSRTWVPLIVTVSPESSRRIAVAVSASAAKR
jgi:hypothetical protein